MWPVRAFRFDSRNRSNATLNKGYTRIGIKSKVVDQLIEELIASPTRADLVAHTRALDRVLQYGYYVVPNFHLAAYRVGYWDKFRRPAVSPKYAVGFDTWWVDPAAEKSVEAKKAEPAKP